MECYETTRKFEKFDDFLRISALITKKFDDALKARSANHCADVHTIEDIIQGPAQVWQDLKDDSIDRLNTPLAWQYKPALPGPVMFIQWKEYGTYLYQFQEHGAPEGETKLLYDTATSVFDEERIEEVKKEQ